MVPVYQRAHGYGEPVVMEKGKGLLSLVVYVNALTRQTSTLKSGLSTSLSWESGSSQSRLLECHDEL